MHVSLTCCSTRCSLIRVVHTEKEKKLKKKKIKKKKKKKKKISPAGNAKEYDETCNGCEWSQFGLTLSGSDFTAGQASCIHIPVHLLSKEVRFHVGHTGHMQQFFMQQVGCTDIYYLGKHQIPSPREVLTEQELCVPQSGASGTAESTE